MMMANDSDSEIIRILAVCTDEKRKAYFQTLGDYAHVDVVIYETMEALRETKNDPQQFDLVVTAVSADTPEMRDMVEAAIAYAHIERVPVLAIAPQNAPDYGEFIYEHNVTECLPSTISNEHLTGRIRHALEVFVNNRQMRVLAARMEKEMEEQRDRLHYRDDLTGCLNLSGFRRRAQEILRAHPDWQYTLWYCDIKDFKYINERLGYSQGDALLRYWGQLSLDYKQEGEVIGCLTGDRFVGLIRITEDNASSPMEGVLEKVRNYFRDKGIDYDVRIVTGVYSLVAKDYEELNIDHMIANAKLAQQRLKDSASLERWGVYNPEQFETERRRMMISTHLQSAINNEEISVYFQPQYNYNTGKLRGAEALCRWKHAELGWVSPGEFIPALEKTGQITDLDMYVWEQVCKCQQKWTKAGIRVPVSVNISREDVLSQNLTEVFTGLLKKYELTTDVLHLEITESSYIDHADVLIREVGNLADAGFSVEMDDFGSGYSSLNMLKEVPVNVLKMDLRFLADEGDSFRGGTIVNYVVRMAHAMHMEVVAEGVETAEQANFLKSCGCSTMQGYLFSRPVPLAEYEEIIRDNRVQAPFVTDTSDVRKYMERLLDAHNAETTLFNRLLGPACIFSYDDEKLELVLANDAMYKELSGKESFPDNQLSYYDRLTDEGKNVIMELLQQALQEGAAAGIIRTVNTMQYLQVRFQYLYTEGKEKYLFCEHQNVTDERMQLDQKQHIYESTYQNMRLQQAKLLALQKVPGVIIFDYDIREDRLDISIGMPDGTLAEKKISRFIAEKNGHQVFAPESVAHIAEIFRKLRTTGGTGSVDVMGNPMGLDYGWLRCTYTSIQDEDGIASHIFGRMVSIESDVRLNEELRAKAQRDAMTDLLNHEASIAGIRIHLKQHEGGTLMMIDVDNFKHINDRNSHLYGDEILKKVAKELWRSFRRTDLIGRFGGDEFIVYMPGAFDEDFALRKARELNRFCNRHHVKNIDVFSLSIGIAIAEENEELTAEEFISRADKALYEVKRGGRNAAIVYKA